MTCDHPRRLQWTLSRSVDNQYRRRRFRFVERASVIEFSKLVDIAQLAELLARLGFNSLFELRVAALKLDEMNRAATGRNAFLQRRNEVVGDSLLGREGHDPGAH